MTQMTQMTQEQQHALQVTAEQVVAKFEDFVAALPHDEQQVLAFAIASAPYVADATVGDAGIQDDTRGFADNHPRPIGLFRLAASVFAAATSVATDLAKDLTKPILPPQPQ